jgi:hypothetical protein
METLLVDFFITLDLTTSLDPDVVPTNPTKQGWY